MKKKLSLAQQLLDQTNISVTKNRGMNVFAEHAFKAVSASGLYGRISDLQ